MTGGRIDRLCRDVLPAEFDRISRLGPAIQAFLEHNLPVSVNRSVSLLTVSDTEIVIAAYTPTVASYLRLHGAEIRQQLREGLDIDLEIRFRSLPQAMLRAAARPPPGTPRAVGAAALDAIERSAASIEDEALRAALLSLARGMKSERD